MNESSILVLQWDYRCKCSERWNRIPIVWFHKVRDHLWIEEASDWSVSQRSRRGHAGAGRTRGDVVSAECTRVEFRTPASRAEVVRSLRVNHRVRGAAGCAVTRRGVPLVHPCRAKHVLGQRSRSGDPSGVWEERRCGNAIIIKYHI